MRRRTVISLIVAGVVVLTSGVALFQFSSSTRAAEITVHKDPNCGCCSAWIEHVKAAGFTVATHDTIEMERIKLENGVPADLASCHTAIAEGYVIEGHVPADDIKRLLAERPQAIGIAVPGMPMGSPGMDQSPMHEPYAVILFQANGERSIFARH